MLSSKSLQVLARRANTLFSVIQFKDKSLSILSKELEQFELMYKYLIAQKDEKRV